MCRGLKHNRVLCDIRLRHIVSTHTSAILSAWKKCSTTVGKNRYKLSVCEVVGSSKRHNEEKKLRLRVHEMSQEINCGQESHL